MEEHLAIPWKNLFRTACSHLFIHVCPQLLSHCDFVFFIPTNLTPSHHHPHHHRSLARTRRPPAVAAVLARSVVRPAILHGQRRAATALGFVSFGGQSQSAFIATCCLTARWIFGIALWTDSLISPLDILRYIIQNCEHSVSTHLFFCPLLCRLF